MLHGREALIMMRCLAAVLVPLALMAAVAPGAAQGQFIRVVGRVQWIAAEKMMLIPDSGDLPIEIDITQAPQSDYQTLTEGDQVVVSGVVSPDGRKVIASSIRPAGGSRSPWPGLFDARADDASARRPAA
jgi:hypothetical protein